MADFGSFTSELPPAGTPPPITNPPPLPTPWPQVEKPEIPSAGPSVFNTTNDGKKKRGRPKKKRPDNPIRASGSASRRRSAATSTPPLRPHAAKASSSAAPLDVQPLRAVPMSADPTDTASSSSTPPLDIPPINSVPMERRRRGRAPVDGSEAAGNGVTWVVVPTGEDVVDVVMRAIWPGPNSICVMSGTGVLSKITLRKTSTDQLQIFEGRFDITTLQGSFRRMEDGGQGHWNGSLNITVSTENWQVMGGVVGGSLIAASPVQLCVHLC